MMKRAILVVVFLFLTAGISSANGELEYKVVMSKNDRLCSYMRDVLNEDVRAYGRGYHQQKFQDSVFQAISWTELGKDFDYYGEAARFDIDNDRRVDIVVRKYGEFGKNVTYSALFIFDEAQYPEAARKRAVLEDNSIGFFNLLSDVHPLIFENTTYLLSAEHLGRKGSYDFIRIAKYRIGKVDGLDPARLEEVCHVQ